MNQPSPHQRAKALVDRHLPNKLLVRHRIGYTPSLMRVDVTDWKRRLTRAVARALRGKR